MPQERPTGMQADTKVEDLIGTVWDAELGDRVQQGQGHPGDFSSVVVTVPFR